MKTLATIPQKINMSFVLLLVLFLPLQISAQKPVKQEELIKMSLEDLMNESDDTLHNSKPLRSRPGWTDTPRSVLRRTPIFRRWSFSTGMATIEALSPIICVSSRNGWVSHWRSEDLFKEAIDQ